MFLFIKCTLKGGRVNLEFFWFVNLEFLKFSSYPMRYVLECYKFDTYIIYFIYVPT